MINNTHSSTNSKPLHLQIIRTGNTEISKKYYTNIVAALPQFLIRLACVLLFLQPL